jgi:hypothetical protein
VKLALDALHLLPNVDRVAVDIDPAQAQDFTAPQSVEQQEHERRVKRVTSRRKIARDCGEHIYMDRFLARRGLSAMVLSMCQLAAAAVMLAIALAVSGVQTPHVNTENIAAIAVLGIIGTGFAYVLKTSPNTSSSNFPQPAKCVQIR